VTNVVFDSVIYLRAAMNAESLWGRILFDHSPVYELFISIGIVREVVDVLTRPGLLRKYRGLAEYDIKRVLSILSDASVVVPASILPVCRDPKDDIFLATSVAADGKYLVSEDRDLLNLRSYRGIEIVDAAGFLRLLSVQRS
jgi:putative PIN family toxin of toxin-antitoxin system